VKNRFQSLPFKCNLQRYNTGVLTVWALKAVAADADAENADGDADEDDDKKATTEAGEIVLSATTAPVTEPDSPAVNRAAWWGCTSCIQFTRDNLFIQRVHCIPYLESAWFQPLSDLPVSRRLCFQIQLVPLHLGDPTAPCSPSPGASAT
jgi:hypothetical protein